MAPLSSQMVPKMLQNGHQNVSPKAPRTQNLECEQIVLFAMFQTHFGSPKRFENVPFFFQDHALVALTASFLATRVSSISLWSGISRPSWGLLVSPLVSQGPPRVSKKIPKNHPKSLLKPGLPVGGSRHAPRLPCRRNKNEEKDTKKARWRLCAQRF